MTTIRVFRFMYFDRATRKMVDSGDFATLRAIQEMGGQTLTYFLDVDAGRVGANGLYITDKSKASGATRSGEQGS